MKTDEIIKEVLEKNNMKNWDSFDFNMKNWGSFDFSEVKTLIIEALNDGVRVATEKFKKQLAQKDAIWMDEIRELRNQKVFFMEKCEKQKVEHLAFLKKVGCLDDGGTGFCKCLICEEISRLEAKEKIK